MSTKFKKLIPFLLILVVLAGAFAFTNKASASEEDPSEACTYNDGGRIGGTVENAPCINTAGEQIGDNSGKRVEKIEPQSPLEDELAPCGVFGDSKLIGCVQWLVYFVFVAAPSFIMVVTANLFNLVAAMTLSSGMYQSTFIQTIWVVVRDLANIFFILILLYAAMQIILDLGHGSSKKIVASVILIALLVNFSLFFTKVVIDSSNIAALIFYNRIDTTNTNYNPIRSDTGEKDMAGALVSKFKINNFFSGDLIKDLKKDPLVKIADEDKLSPYMTMGMMMVYGLVAYALCYSFFMVAMALFGRMLNLMMLMIISPVAFVTKSIPSLSKKENMGFDSWLANLLQTAFMATIFMFILYMVATILKAEIFNVGINPNNQGAAATLVKLFMPAILIAALLLKGVKYSMSASGQFTGMVMKGAGFAGGAVLGGGAFLASGLVGKGLNMVSKSDSVQRWANRKGVSGYLGKKVLNVSDYGQRASFDLRKAPGFGSLAKNAGIDFGSSSLIGLGVKDGGYEGGIKRDAQKRDKELKLISEVNMTDEQIRKKYGANLSDKQVKQKKKEIKEERIKKYKDNLGLDGLLGSAMYSSVGRAAGWLGANEAEKRNAALVAKRTFAVGAGIVLGGGLGLATVGAVGAIQGGGEKKFEKDLEKHEKKEHGLEARIEKAEKTKETEEKFMKDMGDGTITVKMEGPDGTQVAVPAEDLFTTGADGKKSLNKAKVEELVTNIAFQERVLNAQIGKLDMAPGGDKDALYARRKGLQKEFGTLKESERQLERLKSAPEVIEKAEKELERLGEKIDKLEERHGDTPEAKNKESTAETHSPTPKAGGSADTAGHPPAAN